MVKNKKKKDSSKNKHAIKVVDEQELFMGICYDYNMLHPGSLTLALLLDDVYVARAVAAWENVQVEIDSISDKSQNPWDCIWFDRVGWMDAANVPDQHRERVIKTVIQNDLVYADGTLPDVSRAYLMTKANEILGIQTRTGGGDN